MDTSPPSPEVPQTPDPEPPAAPAELGQVVNPVITPQPLTPSTSQPVVIGPTPGAGPQPGPEVYTSTPPEIISANSQPPGKTKLYKKPLLAVPLALLVLLAGSAGAYFGYYVPNQPQNIWKTALTRTGKGYDKLTQYAVTQFKADSGLKLDGKFQTSGFFSSDGTFSGDSDKDNGEFTASVSAGGVKVNTDVRLLKSSTSTPDIYFKIDGIQGLGDLVSGFIGPQYKNAINNLNGKWYFIDHSLFDQISSGNGNNLQISSADVNSVLKAIGDASKQNVFTSDPDKMAFTVKKEVGKEKQDGRSVYHYVAGINKDNLKNYINALCDNLKQSNLKKYFNGDAQSTADAIGCSTASKSVDNFDTSRTADVWVDLHTKLIHKVRITDTKNKDNYFELVQDYQGGDKFPFAMNFHSKDSGLTNDSSINLTLDTKANSLEFKAQTTDSGADNLKASAELTISPHSGKVNVQKPDGAENIIQLLNDLGFADIVNGQVQSQAADTERKTDINALQGQIEAYWADNGFYPTLTNINDPNWRAANMKGMDPEALKDPAGTSQKLAASPAAHVYSYQALPTGCDNVKVQCDDFTLTATLDAGGTYSKQSLNSSDNTPVYQN
jgi:hypothetical protein